MDLPLFLMSVLGEGSSQGRGVRDWGGGRGHGLGIQSNFLGLFVNTYCVIHWRATTMTVHLKVPVWASKTLSE